MSAKPTESMVLTREKRPNAGARMTDLLNKEDCDDFYKSTYGGFFDEENDDAYESPQDSESDYVDSDFDIDEGNKSNVDDEAEDEDYKEETDKRKKTTKAYKEPTLRPRPAVSTPVVDEEQKSVEPKPVVQREPLSTVAKRAHRAISPPPEKKLRQSTVLKSEEYERRREITRQKRNRRKKYQRAADYYEKPSQADLLREAKETEELNLKSLERFQLFELEKRKKSRFGKQRSIKGPYVRFISMTMPDVLKRVGDSSSSLHRSNSSVPSVASNQNQNQNLADNRGDQTGTIKKFYLGDDQSNASGRSTPSMDVVDPDADNGNIQKRKKSFQSGESGKCARTFISFSDDVTFDRLIPNSRKKAKPSIPKPQFCVVTNLPAKYLDPLTKLPYANAEAFKIIRESYNKHVEEKGDKNDPTVVNWLQHRRTSS